MRVSYHLITLKLLLDVGILKQDDLEVVTDVTGFMDYTIKSYVSKRHKYEIWQIEKGARKGYFKTYVGNPRKGIEAKTQDALIEKLFFYYSGINKPTVVTVWDACEWELQYRESVKRTSKESTDRLRSYLKAVLPPELLNSDIRKLTEIAVCDHIHGSIENRHVSYEAVKATLQVLHAACTRAIAKRALSLDPLIGVQASAFQKDCAMYSKRALEKQQELLENAGKDMSEDDLFIDTSEILSPEVTEFVRKHFWKYAETDVSARALLLNTYTGLRIGETPVLMVRDIGKNLLHVHQSQIKHSRTDDSPQWFETVPWTKNERGFSKGGRYIPLDLHPELRPLLKLCVRHAVNGYLFADADGNPVTKDSLRTYLVRHMAMIQKALKEEWGEEIVLKKTNNHVFRKSLNTNELIPKGYTLTERSMMLGHSPKVNLENYTRQDGFMYKGMVERAQSSLAKEAITQSLVQYTDTETPEIREKIENQAKKAACEHAVSRSISRSNPGSDRSSRIISFPGYEKALKPTI